MSAGGQNVFKKIQCAPKLQRVSADILHDNKDFIRSFVATAPQDDIRIGVLRMTSGSGFSG